MDGVDELYRMYSADVYRYLCSITRDASQMCIRDRYEKEVRFFAVPRAEFLVRRPDFLVNSHKKENV